jgi:hypothetical protein
MTTRAREIQPGWKIAGNPVLVIYPSADVTGKPMIHFVMRDNPLDIWKYPDDKIQNVKKGKNNVKNL